MKNYLRFFDFMHLILLDCDIYYPSCIAFCNAFLDENENREQLIQDFIENAKKYIDIQELTPEILRAFISRIEVHEKAKWHSTECGNDIVISFTVARKEQLNVWHKEIKTA